MNVVALQMGVTMSNDSVVETTVHLVGDMKGLDMGLRVEMKVRGASKVDKEKMRQIVDKAKEVCPYSRATKGNVETTIELV